MALSPLPILSSTWAWERLSRLLHLRGKASPAPGWGGGEAAPCDWERWDGLDLASMRGPGEDCAIDDGGAFHIPHSECSSANKLHVPTVGLLLAKHTR